MVIIIVLIIQVMDPIVYPIIQVMDPIVQEGLFDPIVQLIVNLVILKIHKIYSS